MMRLSGLDASFLYLESSSQLLHVCGIIMVDPSTMAGGYSFERMLSRIDERSRTVPEFRRKLHHVPLHLDHPVWVDDPDFDIDHHVHRIGCPAPCGDRELAEVCAHIAGQPLDRSRPLWEMWVIEGLANGKVAIMSKMHHSTVDGVSGANMIAHLCSLEPDTPPVQGSSDPRRITAPSDVELVGRALLNAAKRPWGLARLMGPAAEVVPQWIQRAREGRAMPAPFTAPRTSFNGTVTGHRSVAFTEFDLDEVKEVKNILGGTVNDVVLSVCSGALRRYLQERGELPRSSLVAMVPVSVHDRTARKRGSNKVTGMFAKLGTDIADPVERLRAISAANTSAKEHSNAIDADLLQDWAHFAAPRTFGLAVRVYSALRLAERHPVVHNLVISNVPGPPVPLYFLGARIDGLYPLGPVFHGAGLNVTVMSNDGRINVGLLACRELMPSDAVWTLADALPAAMGELLRAARKERSRTERSSRSAGPAGSRRGQGGSRARKATAPKAPRRS
ncbi:MAG: wax ester/triacylglycerol synthase family O-acyltransferase [Actinomycetota bacterium]|nr:wax ester/triacylglycerol synthase family O-acyltransferase [Actinomycetota bacterium]